MSLSFLVIAFHISFNFNDLLNINLSVFRLLDFDFEWKMLT